MPVEGAPAGGAATVSMPPHSGHFISWPAYCSGTASIFWQRGHKKFIVPHHYAPAHRRDQGSTKAQPLLSYPPNTKFSKNIVPRRPSLVKPLDAIFPASHESTYKHTTW